MKSILKRVAGFAVGAALALGFVSCVNNTETKIEYVEKTYCSPVIFSSEDLGDNCVKVTMATATEGAAIYYTTDGAVPTTESKAYTAPVTFTQDATVKAIAVKEGIENSPISVATVSIVDKTVEVKKYICPGCKKEYDSAKEASDCHGMKVEVEKPVEVTKYVCPKCKETYDTAQEAADCCGVQKEEVEKLVYTSELAAGTYTVYHFQQKTTGGKAVSDYVLESTENSKSVAAESTIADLKKTYEGFTEKAMAQNETAIYVFYDRNTITYTFQTGTEGKFEDGTTSKEVSGLYGESYSKPEAPTSGDYNFVKWQDSSETAAPSTFGAEDKTWTAVWRAKSEGNPTINDDFVEITYAEGDFYISPTELTYTEWYEVYQWAVTNGYIFQDLGREGSNGTDGAAPTEGSKQPVTYVSWRDAVVWCNAASEKAGLTPVYEYEGSVLKEAENYSSWGTNSENTTSVGAGNGKAEKATVNTTANGYRLPTEAEWEYAAKGGANFTYSGSNNIDEVAWYRNNSSGGTKDVGTKAANGYKLHDMSGNVWEWCWDTYSSGSSVRVCRGGSWSDVADGCAVSFRLISRPYALGDNFGFRVVRSSSN